jgi:single-stranded-DNA-specific exonuclease
MKHRDLFIGVGGHEMACGFSIPVQNVPILRQLLNEECTLTDDDLIKNIYIDYDIEAQVVTMKLATELLALEPYGKGNPKPLFQLQNCQVLKHQYIGANKKTLKLTLLCLDYQFECIGFNMADKMGEIWFEALEEGLQSHEVWIDIAFYPGINEWNGRKSLQLELTDIKKS